MDIYKGVGALAFKSDNSKLAACMELPGTKLFFIVLDAANGQFVRAYELATDVYQEIPDQGLIF